MNWTSRLGVAFDTGSGNVSITPIVSFQPTITSPGDVIHSLEQTHVGFIFSPQTIAFTMTVVQTGTALAALTALCLQRKKFNIVLLEQSGNDWSFETILLRDCLITSVQVGPIAPTGAPSAILQGVSLHVTETFLDASGT